MKEYKPNTSDKTDENKEQLFFEALGKVEPAAIRQLAGQIKSAAFRKVSLTGLSREDAEEVVNDALFITVTNIKNGKFLFQKISPVFYAKGIIHRLIANRMRTKKTITSELNENTVPINFEIEEYLIKKERKLLIGELLSKLGETCQKILRLKFFKKVKDKEIIEEKLTNLTTINSLKSKRSQCMKKLTELGKKITGDEKF